MVPALKVILNVASFSLFRLDRWGLLAFFAQRLRKSLIAAGDRSPILAALQISAEKSGPVSA
jgi:hypothetical protein